MTRCKATILTGFLGAGKTTVLNHLLAATPGERTAVVVNEFGDVGVDGELIVETAERVVEISNGCVCCTVRGDLIEALRGLVEDGPEVDRYVVETSGLADPAPVIQSFLLDEVLATRLQLDAIVTVVDARHLGDQLDHDEAVEQIAFADVVLLNKTDLVDAADLDAREREVRALNPLARILRTERGVVPPQAVLDVGAFDLKNLLAIEPDLLADHDHEHDPRIGSVAVVTPEPIDAARFDAFMVGLTQRLGRDLLRCKGVLHVAGAARRSVFHGVHMTLEGRPGRPWAPGEPRASKIVFIGRDLDAEAIRAGLRGCLADAPALAS